MDDTGIRIVAFAAAIGPPLIVLLYFMVAARVPFDSDLIWPSFGFGACAAFPAIMAASLFETVVGYGSGLYEISANQAFFGAAVPEELFKLIAVLCVCWQQLRELRPNQIFMLAIACACGFACFENIFYVVEGGGWYQTAITRSITAVPGHAFVGAVMGFCIVKAIRSSVSFLWWGLSLILPIILHGAYDFFLFAVQYMEARHVGALTDLTQTLVTLFIITVIVEGVLAHIALHSVLKITDMEVTSKKPATWIQRVGERNLLWLILGFFCLIIAFILSLALTGATEDADRSMGLGFAAILALHGAAFIVLAAVISRRMKEQGTKPFSS